MRGVGEGGMAKERKKDKVFGCEKSVVNHIESIRIREIKGWGTNK